MSDRRCPLCHSALEYRVGRGLELRRYPRGQMVCPHDLKRWHLKLENMQREIELCKDQVKAIHLRAEFEDMLLQHLGNTVQQPANDRLQQYLEPLETA